MNNSLQHGIDAFRSGNKAEARKIFLAFVENNPQSGRGWECLYNASENNKERLYCLKEILRINPGNKKAQRLIERFPSVSSPIGSASRNTTGAQKHRISIPAVGAGVAFLMLFVCVGLAAASSGLAGQNNLAGYGCLLPWLNGTQLCNSSLEATQTIPEPVSLVATVAPTASPIPSIAPTDTLTPTLIFTSTLTYTPTLTFTPTVTFTPTNPPTSGPNLRLNAALWRKWPIVPEFSPRAQAILREALKNPALDPHAFSKVGDCQMTAGTFLAGYVNGKYKVPEGYEGTVKWFSASMTLDDITAVNGYGINTVLDPAFGLSAGYDQCLKDETPLDCELRIRRPIIVLVGMGTNWIPNAETSFEKYLRQIVDRVLETGALPILATKADNVEGNWKLNEVIAEVAYDYDLPLVNVWLSVQKLPNQGLEQPPRQVYLTGDGWMKRNYAWLVVLDNVRKTLAE